MKKLALSIKTTVAAVLLAALVLIPNTVVPTAAAATYLDRGNVTALAYLGGATAETSEIAVATKDEIFFLTESGTPAQENAGETTVDKPAIAQSGVTAMAATSDALYAIVGGNLCSTADFASAIASGVTLIASDKTDLYYYDGAAVYLYADGAATEKFAADDVTSLAALDGNVYYLSGGAVYENDAILYENSSLKSLTAIGGELYGINLNNEIVLARDESVIYAGKAVSVLAPAGEKLLFSTTENEIYLFGDGKATLVAASASDEEGFYDYPLKAVARLGKLYVADYSNHRVAIVSNTDDKTVYEYLSVPFPRSVAVASDGAVYVASNKNIVKFAGGESETIYVASARVTDLFLSHGDDLYCVAGKTLYSVKNNETLAENVDGGTVYSGGQVVVYAGADVKKTDGTAVVTLPSPIKSLAADNDGNLYALTDGASTNLYKITNGVAELKKSDLPKGSASVYVSRSSSPIGSFGDVVIADKNANAILTVSADDAGVSPVPSAPEASDFDDERIFRFAKTDAVLYNSTDEADVAATLKKDERVIVLKYDFGYGYAYCAVENEREELIYGYAFRSTLTEPLAYVEPAGAYCVVYSDSVKLYSLPSKGSPVTKNLSKNDLLDMLAFPTCEWYRVKMSDGTIGYVPVGTVSINSFVPDGDRPQINGEIIEYNGETDALTYLKTANGYEAIDGVSLPAGTKIEVVEGFDTSVPYTQIRYYDDRLGTLTCYVKTVHVRFYSISTVQIIAIVVAALTFILLVLLLIRLYMRRRKI